MSELEFLTVDVTNYCCKKEQFVPTCISEISGDNKSYLEFFNEYLLKNIPCIIKNVTHTWESSQWESNGIPNLPFLLSKYGSNVVPISDCKKPDQLKRYILFKEYVKYLSEISPCEVADSVLYLKDWHLRKESPEDDFYHVPKYFASDWLNEYSVDNKRDDYMFVYFGPKGSWTPFHADVYTSFSWSANVVGQKKWLLLPPGEELKFIDTLGNLPSNIENLINSDHTYFEVIQNAGDAIFVPSGWHHQVYNVEDTISINHNWVNSCNIATMLESLKMNAKMVENEIIEFKDSEGWMEHCQLMLQTLYGMNYDGFYQFVKYISEKRLDCLKNGTNLTFANWNLSAAHIIFDLKALKYIIECLIAEPYLDQNSIEKLEEIVQNINLVI